MLLKMEVRTLIQIKIVVKDTLVAILEMGCKVKNIQKLILSNNFVYYLYYSIITQIYLYYFLMNICNIVIYQKFKVNKEKRDEKVEMGKDKRISFFM